MATIKNHRIKNNNASDFMKGWTDVIEQISFEKKETGRQIKAGDKLPLKNKAMKYIKVMAIVDGYVMFRYRGCIAACEKVAEFIKRVRRDCELEIS